MSTVVSAEPRIQRVRITRDRIIADLADGRVVSVPLAWSWRLSEATPAQRGNFRLIGAGQGVDWPEVDADLSVEGFLHGIPARRPKSATTTRERPNQAAVDRRIRPAVRKVRLG